MRVLHVGGYTTPDRVAGVNAVVWQLAAAQRQGGDEVALLHHRPDGPREVAVSETGHGPLSVALESPPSRRRLTLVPTEWVRRALEAFRPQVVHLHSVFAPYQTGVARALRQLGVPYVVGPAGGLSPEVLQRSPVKKRAALALVERPMLRGAAAIVAITPAELDDVRRVLPRYGGRLAVIPNPIAPLSTSRAWSRTGGAPSRALFLGRFDVHHKGLDLLSEMARQLPDLQFDLFGSPAARDHATLDRLRADAPSNLAFHDPVYGDAKIDAFIHTNVYVQPSRWEAFGISVGEALSLGTPVAIAATAALAPVLEEHRAAVILPLPDVDAASAALRRALADPDELAAVGERGAAFAAEHLAPPAVAARWAEVYREAVG